MVNVYVVEKEIINDPMFDLIPEKHGHILDKNGKINEEFKEVTGVRLTVPLFEINPSVLFQMADFIDDMDGTVTHPEITIVVKEANKEHNIPAKIGIFAV